MVIFHASISCIQCEIFIKPLNIINLKYSYLPDLEALKLPSSGWTLTLAITSGHVSKVLYAVTHMIISFLEITILD